MGRSVQEWVGATPDAKPPPSVRLRTFDRYDGFCYLTGRKIRAGDKWELEHIKSLRNGGENRESNLAPALVDPHKEKTAQERDEGAKADRIRKKHLGLYRSRSPMNWRKRTAILRTQE
jgi:5-methylcytosine-specific restriction endonuclease McrA